MSPSPSVPIRCHYCERRLRHGEPRVTELERSTRNTLIVCSDCAYRHERAEQVQLSLGRPDAGRP